MHLFWSRGYEALGMTELLEEMGISRQSLYSTFGSKRSLFIRSIEHYRATQLTTALALLEREGSQLDNVKAVVRFFERLAADRDCRGCFVANALVEMGARDEEIGALLGDTLQILQKALRRSLREAQQRGELSADKAPTQLSRALTNALVGLSVTGKLEMGRAALRDIYAGTLHMLD